MKILTQDGSIEAKVIKHIIVNNRKVSIHHLLGCFGEFESEFVASDYATGLQIQRSKARSVAGAISNAEHVLSTVNAKNYDYSKHEIINT